MKLGPCNTSPELSPAPSSLRSRCPELEIVSLHLMSFIGCPAALHEGMGKNCLQPACRWVGESRSRGSISSQLHSLQEAEHLLTHAKTACSDILQGLWVLWSAMDSWNGNAKIFLSTLEDTHGYGWVQKHVKKCVHA